MTGRDLRVLHVLASDQRRGAEVFAADLIAATAAEVQHDVRFLRSRTGARVTYPCPAAVLPGGRRGAAGVPRVAWELRRYRGGRDRPRVVVAHGGESFRAAALAFAGTGIPLVYRRIGMAPGHMTNGWRLRYHRALIGGRATRVVCLAEVVRAEVVEELGVAPDRVLMIPNAVDPGRLAPPETSRGGARMHLGVPADARVVLSICALSWEKDPLGLLEVTAPILTVDPRVHHVFAGDGPLRAELEQRVAALGLERSVHVLGSRDDAGRLFAAADAVLFASRPRGMEGMPTILIEAGIAARAVAAYAVPGVDEVVVDGETGALVPPGDASGLRVALRALLDDPDRAEAFGTAARARCEERFTITRVAPCYVDLWRALASRAQ